MLEPLHGVTFGCSCTAAVDFAASISPAGLEATSQAVMGSLQSGVGSLVGTSVGAFIEEKYGPHMMYRGAAAVILVTSFAYLVSWRLCTPPEYYYAGDEGRSALEILSSGDRTSNVKYERVPVVGEDGTDNDSQSCKLAGKGSPFV
jgi:hypothetical protein